MVPLLESELVQPGYCLTTHDFLLAVATFARYPVAGLPGAAVLLGRPAIGDRLAAVIAAGGLAALIRFGIGNAVLVGIAGFPLLYPAWTLAR